MSSDPVPPLAFHPNGAFVKPSGISRADLERLAPLLEAARHEILVVDEELYRTGGPYPPEKNPLDHGFLDLPQRMLEAYHKQRPTSELHRILQLATRLRDSVDRVVVLGIGGSYMAAKALMDGCCDPYFNELSRAERGCRPRMYFEGNNLDNDATQGLLKLLGGGRPASTIDQRWAIVVVSKSGGTLETAVAFRQFLAALQLSCGGDHELVAPLVVPVTGKVGRLAELAATLKCPDIFEVPNGVGGRYSIFSAVGILPAAILGIDVVRLLEGAIAMNEHFRTAPVGCNVVLDYVGVCHLLEAQRGINLRCLSVWAKALESAGLWYDQLLAESLGKDERGATPYTAVNTRDLHSRAQQHQEGRRDKLMTNLIVDRWRSDQLVVGTSDRNEDQLNEHANRTLPDLMDVALRATNMAYGDVGRPTVDLRLPKVDEASLGQFFQLMMLATAVEGRLLGINPYGQPGVEHYKRNIQKLL